MANAYYYANREAVLAKQAAWRAANRELYLERKRASNARNSASRCAKAAAWAAEHPECGRARVAKRRAARVRRTVAWESELTALVMREAHDLARRREGKWEVDHVVPLQGDKVSGLHVWNNVQVIPRTPNRVKSNTWSIQ